MVSFAPLRGVAQTLEAYDYCRETMARRYTRNEIRGLFELLGPMQFLLGVYEGEEHELAGVFVYYPTDNPYSKDAPHPSLSGEFLWVEWVHLKTKYGQKALRDAVRLMQARFPALRFVARREGRRRRKTVTTRVNVLRRAPTDGEEEEGRQLRETAEEVPPSVRRLPGDHGVGDGGGPDPGRDGAGVGSAPEPRAGVHP